jgi:acetate kinase
LTSRSILTLNAGSSSIRFSVHAPPDLGESARGKVDRLSGNDPLLILTDSPSSAATVRPFNRGGGTKGAALVEALEAEGLLDPIVAVGHRIVHGMDCPGSAVIDEMLLEKLRTISVHDRQHLPLAIELIEALESRFPNVLQVACFDTSFHRSIPRVARILPIPRRFGDAGIQRYGFHGVSYTFILEELERQGGLEVARGRVILAHLGGGSSLAAVRDGRCVDTTMGFTPTGGLPMGSRSGDLDPGVLFAMARTERLSLEDLESIVETESGLLGLSGRSGDVRDLLDRELADPQAAEAIDVFCHHARKGIGAMAAVLGGLDTLVFTGGIGENAAEIRSRICRDLGFLGVNLEEPCNIANAPVISPASARVTVRVIPTDEERMIARETWRLMRSIER